MRDPLPVPRTGDPMRASWGAGVATRLNELCGMAAPRSLARDGMTGLGSEPLPVNRRDRKAAAPHPWQWRAVSDGEGGVKFQVYLPWGSLVDGDWELDATEIDNLIYEEDTGDEWYTLDLDFSGGKYLYLSRTNPTGSTDPSWAITTTADGDENFRTAYVTVVPASGTRPAYGRIDMQIFVGAFVFTPGGGGSGAMPDGLSIDDDGSGGSLELLDFQTADAEDKSVAEQLTGSNARYNAMEAVERYENERTVGGETVTENKVRYRKLGGFYAASDTNITFTSDGQGGVQIGVYYK